MRRYRLIPRDHRLDLLIQSYSIWLNLLAFLMLFLAILSGTMCFDDLTWVSDYVIISCVDDVISELYVVDF